MLVPDELSLHLDQFHQEIIQLADDFGTPVGGKAGKFLGKVDFCGIHKSLDCDSAPDEPKSCKVIGLLRGGGGFDRLHVDGIAYLVKRSHYLDIFPRKSSGFSLIVNLVLQISSPQNIAILLTDDGSHERSSLLLLRSS